MGIHTEDEPTLWDRSLAHDERAFAALFDLHRDRVFRHVLRLVESRQDAEDVTAAAFFELWHRRSKVRIVGGSVLPWLLVTTTNVARNNTRSRRRYAALVAALPRSAETSEDPADLVAEAAESDATARRVRHVLGALRDTDATLLSLVVLENMTLSDAATALGVSHGAARTRLHRLKSHARSLLTAVDDEPVPIRIVKLPLREGRTS
jgi:RNA polymerase sigma factor (sigma-70 family)